MLTSLPTPADVRRVAEGANGLKAGLRPGSTWFDLSTNDVHVVRTLNAELAEQEVEFLDAPVSGGPAGAASGDLAIWAGGSEDAFTRHQDLLGAMSDRASYLGPIGSGTITKLVHNTASAAISRVVIEVLTLGVKAGIEPLALYGALRQGAAGRSRSFDSVSRRLLQGKFDPPSFQLRLVHKDVGLASKLAEELDVPMALTDLVLADISEAMERGWGQRDSQTALLLQSERAGIEPFALTAAQVDDLIART